jgi:hypothetical protein
VHLNSNVTLRLLQSQLQGYFKLLIPTYKMAPKEPVGLLAVGLWAEKSSRCWKNNGQHNNSQQKKIC